MQLPCFKAERKVTWDCRLVMWAHVCSRAVAPVHRDVGVQLNRFAVAIHSSRIVLICSHTLLRGKNSLLLHLVRELCGGDDDLRSDLLGMTAVCCVLAHGAGTYVIIPIRIRHVETWNAPSGLSNGHCPKYLALNPSINWTHTAHTDL